jgi:hypothetical protein
VPRVAFQAVDLSMPGYRSHVRRPLSGRSGFALRSEDPPAAMLAGGAPAPFLFEPVQTLRFVLPPARRRRLERQLNA